jgi:hypothetical protein
MNINLFLTTIADTRYLSRRKASPATRTPNYASQLACSTLCKHNVQNLRLDLGVYLFVGLLLPFLNPPLFLL